MAKVYIANTPLILQDGAGKDFRVKIGEAVELEQAQYELVAAHVTPTLTTGEELDAQQEDEKTPSETEPETKTKTQRKTKADA
ncbi:hypothetical protein LVJ83_04725 [Uruburuella testudinis]|uniref:Phage protein n=1 Tax=Uruburuella testudinis TaxID=1282863 RepID=A0ABY4DUR5_9NEIS|nr:hypothetical protein [Uruburuella testudinis]UOO82773.1 hypothetical protein LVJ83_04725 [Uruburuella testudinis]